MVDDGQLKLKAKQYGVDLDPIEQHCKCSTCQNYSRAYLHNLLKANDPLAAQLVTKHNIAYMMRLMRTMRQVRWYSVLTVLLHVYEHALLSI